MEASQQQILVTKKRVIRKVGYVVPIVKPVVVLLDPHECLKCNKIGDWTEVYYDEFLCGVCIHGKCLTCETGIYGKTHGEELCEPCFDKYKAWNIEHYREK